MDYLQEKYDDLLWEYRKLKREYEKLQQKCRASEDELHAANFRISQELEPRIKQEKRAYDNWLANPER